MTTQKRTKWRRPFYLNFLAEYLYTVCPVQAKDAVYAEYQDLWNKFSKEFKEARCMIEDEGKKAIKGTEQEEGETAPKQKK
jgi:hypothetical protein